MSTVGGTIRIAVNATSAANAKPSEPNGINNDSDRTAANSVGKSNAHSPIPASTSPYMNNRAGSDVVELSYGGRVWRYDFGKNTISEGRQ